ncbi:MAG: hypothetical protein COW11_06175 [Candidatus Omnitrophica bacterium CG12_big_fil_rev_8_21_14_0_65_43_15]|uniref:Cysteine-rich small domain-containing protein n=1 Tax=Candidatus Taenaricola geysiri TaxID=1974752 RepID=A0A2J0LJW8_9BACT|nr:MAG: hypothetical protein AUJ89_02265 [Candidatus Omnitrophica bacterium CG1_02_43_210]PIV11651.1 MAG: hypothetical protein COS48_04965 [Candidatus Omnitrophica bacterium CG03_land_8_20_14_0_80_43_22]PIW65893.1 MAG: hypothetical protein COW11_06175 [Candidatus Omnitrophica bacterium CG12_big_fil_rev_8_21_14_0_65_43_15]PIW80089.1 MAG: hypothetical protein COZ98_04155 [Candidatus Omnitrophica bacterium CG_4_8_14_3_um_filter_43_15]PIY83806.1 MAG: hypothetical protein COY77_04930 [Candidatus Omn
MAAKRINKYCKFYPCHKKLEDCTFCWCPFYPCLKKKRGYYVHSKKTGKKIWACDKCGWIHKKSTVDKIFKSIRVRSDF